MPGDDSGCISVFGANADKNLKPSSVISDASLTEKANDLVVSKADAPTVAEANLHHDNPVESFRVILKEQGAETALERFGDFALTEVVSGNEYANTASKNNTNALKAAISIHCWLKENATQQSDDFRRAYANAAKILIKIRDRSKPFLELQSAIGSDQYQELQNWLKGFEKQRARGNDREYSALGNEPRTFAAQYFRVQSPNGNHSMLSRGTV